MADRKSGKGTQRKARARTAASQMGGTATKKAALSKKAAVSKKTVSKPKTAQTKVTSGASKPASRQVRTAAARAEHSPLPPLPPPLGAPPKKLSRSLVRRAVCASTAAQKGGSLKLTSAEPVSESDLREKMRLASLYIDTWLNRRMIVEAHASAPEEAWMQIWLWLKRAAPFDDGRLLTPDLLESLYADEIARNTKVY